MQITPEAIDYLLKLKSEFELLLLDEDFTIPPNAPASEETIQVFEATVGYRLPKEYRSFLLLHDGWPEFDGDAPLLGVSGRDDVSLTAFLNARSGLFDEFGDENPITSGGLPIVIGAGIDNMLFYFPDGPDAGKFVSYDSIDREDVFDTFADFICSETESLVRLIRREKDGNPQDER